MKIRYFSDLHLEFIKPNEIDKFIKKIPTGFDEICICAGDIGNPYDNNYNTFMNYVNEHFKKTFVIAGNHEYYNKKDIKETNQYLVEYFDKFNNISFLHNSIEYYCDYCFIGSTLWSKITNPCYEINDVYKIPNFNYHDYNKLNAICIDFLENSLEKNVNCIVITHHVPSNTLIDIKYKTSSMEPFNQWFYSDLDILIEKHKTKIKCWIYGHTHTTSYNTIHEIPFLCNPIGYPNENIVDFSKTIILD